MNKILLFFLLVLSSGITGFAQNEGGVVVERSKNKVVIDGKEYYVHIVKKGQTLYSISKAYNISQKEIAEENPDIVMGLKTGQVLKIPYSPVKQDVDLIKSDDYVYHILKEGQTLYFLSKKYGISIEGLLKANPELEYSNLQINQVIKIPKSEIGLQDTTQEVKQEKYFFYRVEKGETLYSLAKRFNVTVQNIRDINDDLRWQEPKAGQIIKIPKVQETVKQALPPGKDTISIDTTTNIADTLTWNTQEYFNCDSLAALYKKDSYNVALLIPFNLDYAATRNGVNGPNDLSTRLQGNSSGNPEPIDPITGGYLEFYEGALMAVDKMKREGMSVNLYVYDTGADNRRTGQIIGNYQFSEMDLIIGPFYPKQLSEVANYARQHKIPMVSPMAPSDSLLNNNPYVFQVNPSRKTEFSQLAHYLSDFKDKNLIVLHKQTMVDSLAAAELKNELFKYFSMTNAFDNTVIKDVPVNKSNSSSLNHALTKDKQNIIIIPSSEEVFVTDAIRTIYNFSRNYDIMIVGGPSWPQFKSIDIEYLHALQLHYYTPFFINYNGDNTKKFLGEFKDIYKFEPYHTSSQGYNPAYLGYDIFSFFLKALKEYGDSFPHCINEVKGNFLLSNYHFIKRGYNGGYENESTQIIRYTKDFEVKETEKFPQELKATATKVDW